MTSYRGDVVFGFILAIQRKAVKESAGIRN